MSSDEYNFLFNERKNADKLYGLGTVCGVNGLIVLPDGWDFNLLPSVNPVSDESHYSNNTMDKKKWYQMELLGAVFLPAIQITYNPTNLLISGMGCYFLEKNYFPKRIPANKGFCDCSHTYNCYKAYFGEFDFPSSKFKYGMVRLVR